MIDCKKTLLLKVIDSIYYSGAFNINTFRPQWGIWYCRSCNINWLPGAQGENQTCSAMLAQLLRCLSNLFCHCKRFMSLFARHNFWSPPGFSFRPCLFLYINVYVVHRWQQVRERTNQTPLRGRCSLHSLMTSVSCTSKREEQEDRVAIKDFGGASAEPDYKHTKKKYSR